MADETNEIKIGDRVRSGVFVGGEWKPMAAGIVVGQSKDRSTSMVDVMSLHGGAPWVRFESTAHLVKETLQPKEPSCPTQPTSKPTSSSLASK